MQNLLTVQPFDPLLCTAAAAQSNKAADLLKNICEWSPSPEVSSSKSGARLASMSLPSSGSSRKRQRSTVSPDQRPADCSGMDPLAAAAAALEADDKEDPPACGGQAETGECQHDYC